ncbi:DENN domain-containing protein 2A-like isoform X2 [Schistocerca gregaria]|nr:DENN domain-containing protein 2A-like isoform X2 [Schistocerca gregaria]
MSESNKRFTFTVTKLEGQKRFGYCRRHLIGFNLAIKRWPICFCIISSHYSHVFFYRILDELINLDTNSVLQLVTQLRSREFPLPGESVCTSITINPMVHETRVFNFDRPLQDTSLSGFADFKLLFKYLDPFTIVAIIIALLAERRMIFFCKNLSVLTSCLQACISIIYPFVWQHVFIPVLPSKMMNFVCAPVPFVIGIIANLLGELQSVASSMEEVMIIDIDASTISPPPTDIFLLPEKILINFLCSVSKMKQLTAHSQRNVFSDIEQKFKSMVDSTSSKSKRSEGQDNLAQYIQENFRLDERSAGDLETQEIEAIINNFFYEIFSHYTKFITESSFDRQGFIEYRKNLRPLLEIIAGSQLFEQFIVQTQLILASSRKSGKKLPFSEPSQPPFNMKSDYEANPRASINITKLKPTAIDLDSIFIREGFLKKYGKGIKGTAWARWKEGKDYYKGSDDNSKGTFQQRYWRLGHNYFSYYKKKNTILPAGAIMLKHISHIKIVEFKGIQGCMEINTDTRKYILYSEDINNILYWIHLLEWRIKVATNQGAKK